jgi:3-deoxy-D-manno-octulosonic-acid transferase
MYLLYSALLSVAFVALLPRFLFDAFRHGKYITGLGQRLGHLPHFSRNGKPVIWLHCVSVGETQAARPLVSRLRASYPNYDLVISTTTVTGQKIAEEVFHDLANLVFYFPIDWRWTTRRAINHIKPSVVLLMENEMWPNFLFECQRLQIPVAILNGRLSSSSHRRYKLVSNFMARVVSGLKMAIMQTEEDAGRLIDLGVSRNSVAVAGNLKFDFESDPSEQEVVDELRGRFGLDDSRPLLLAASTHSPEERILIDAFKELTREDSGKRLRLMIAPRHPKRFSEVAAILDSSKLTRARRSDPLAASDKTSDVILLDSIGELRSIFSLATIVFVGGSIANSGGHSILEPAAAGVCIVTGPHTFNFASVVSSFLEERALIQLDSQIESAAAISLVTVIRELIDNESRRTELADRARNVVEQHRGATDRTIKALATILDSADE